MALELRLWGGDETHLQVHGSQVQFDPHLHPFSAPIPISDASNRGFATGATPMTRVWVVVVVSAMLKSACILHPPQPLPHLQPAPQPQFPPQQDIFSVLGKLKMEKCVFVCLDYVMSKKVSTTC